MKTQKKTDAKQTKGLSKKDQKSTNGGSALGGDNNSSLTSMVGVNLHSSHTDEDGQTESSSLGGNFGSSTKSMTED